MKKELETVEQAAQRITYRPKERMKHFRDLSISRRSAVFNVLSPNVRQKILKKLSDEEVVDLLDHLDLRRVQHILDNMQDLRRRKRIIKRLKNDIYARVERFLQFHPEVPATLLHLNYVFLSDSMTIGETAEIIEDYVHNTGKIPEVLVNRNGEMMGEVPLNILVRERNSSKLKHHIAPIKTILYTSSKEEIVATFTAEPHKKIAVLDEDGSVLGIVYSDDVIDLLGESPGATLYSFAGVEESERPFDGVWSKVKKRYRWLIVNLGTAFLAAGVVALFEDTLAEIVLLAIYMPIVAGMGGNAATQTLAVMVRGIAIGEITLQNSKPAIIREVLAGLTNGVIVGVLVTLIAILLNQNPILGLIVGLAVVFSLVIAGFFGTVIPLLLRALGRDPATSASIFITTATDVLGFFVLLGLAALIL